MSEPRGLTPSARVYVGSVILLGVLLLVACLPSLVALRPSGAEAVGLLVFTACTIAAQLFPVIGPKDEAYQLSFVFVFAGALLLSPGSLALVIVVAFAVAWLRSRRPWHVEAFNAANFLIDAYCARAVYVALANGASLAAEPLWLGAAVVAALVFTLTNRGLLAIVLHWAEGHSWRSAGVSRPTGLLIDLALAGLGVLGALLWQVAPLFLGLLLTPLFLIYRALQTPALEEQVRTDAKTGLYNSRFLAEKLSEELRRAKRFDRPLTVIIADLDLLREVNNRYGHLAGDVVLRGVADIVRAGLREYDVAARFGGEEFVIVLPECAAVEGVVVAERIRKRIAAARFAVPTSVEPLAVTLSFGVADFPACGLTVDEIIHRADVAMYAAKTLGRNRVLSADEAGALDADDSLERGRAPGRGGALASSTIAEQPARVTPPGAAARPAAARGESAAPAGRVVLDVATGAAEPGPAVDLAATSSMGENSANSSPAGRRAGRERASDLPPRVALLIGLVTAATVGLWLAFRPWQVDLDWLGLIGLAVLTVGSQWLAIETYGLGKISTGGVFVLAGGLLFGYPGALILAAVLAVATWVLRRGVFYKALFDLSNTTLWSVAAVAVYGPLAGLLVGLEPVVLFVPAMLAALVYYVVNVCLLSLVFSLIERRSLLAVWREKFSWMLPYYVIYGLLALLIVFGYRAIGLYGLLAFVLPPAMMRYALKQVIDRTTSNVAELQRVNKQLVHAHESVVSTLNELRETYHSTLTALSTALDTRDSETEGHSRRVVAYAEAIATAFGVPAADMESITHGAHLHDVGKIGVPDAILGKPGKLTPDEWDVMRRHPTIGYRMLEHIGFLRGALPVVLHHHERFDGRGYPDGLAGAAIPLGARIFAVADTFDAMMSDRPYRQACSFAEARAEIERCAGSQFDPEVVAAFLRVDWQSQPGVEPDVDSPAGRLAAVAATG